MSTTTTATGMPKITTTSSSATSATSALWTTPTITPPAAYDNPYIWRTSAPSGTVFIAVGAVAGFILLCFILFLILRSVFARRSARNSLGLEDDSSSSSFSHGGSAEKNSYLGSSHINLRTSVSNGKIPLLYSTSGKEASNSSVSDVSDPFAKPNDNMFSVLDSNDNKRRSMFISPTAEVMGFKGGHNRVVSNMNHFASTTTITGGGSETGSFAQPRQNRHERSGSYDNYTDVSLQSPERSGSQRAYTGRTRTVPSQYLESMFEDN